MLQHFVELVGDEHDGRALFGELTQRLEERVDLLGHENSGGLIEDEDVGAAVQHLQDLDTLLVANTQIRDQRVGIDVETVPFAEVPNPGSCLVCVERQLRSRLLAEHDVFPDREVDRQHEGLEHHADAVGDGVLR